MNTKIQCLLRSFSSKLPKNHGCLRYLQTISLPGKHLFLNIGSVVNENTIKRTLEEFSLPFVEGYTCFHVKDCKMCKNKEPKSESSAHIFINKKTGFFLCEQCKVTGIWSTFNELLIKARNNSQSEITFLKSRCSKYNKYAENWENIVSETSLLSDLKPEKIGKVLKAFNLVKINKKILETLQVRVNSSSDILYFPLTCSKSDVIGYRTFNLQRQSTTVPKQECSGCIIYPSGQNEAIVVARISDLFAILSQNLPYTVICLPHGDTNLPQSSLPFLEKFDKLILWLDGDSTLDSTGSFSRKLIDKRCYQIRPMKNLTSAETAMLNGENIKQIIKNAKRTWHDHIITFNSLRDEVLMELQNKDLAQGVQWQRFKELNKIIKGHRRGEMTILTGPTGVGKTTFVSEYSLDLVQQGVNTLWGSFEVKNSRLAKIMLQQFAKKPLPDNLIELNSIADKFEELPIFFMTFRGHQKVSDVMDAIRHCSYVYDIAHVVIDNIQFMIEIPSKNINFDRFSKQDFLIQAFRNFATLNNCHVTLVMHPRKEMCDIDLNISSIYGGVKAGQEADNIIIIQNKIISSERSQKFLEDPTRILRIGAVLTTLCAEYVWHPCGQFPESWLELMFQESDLDFWKVCGTRPRAPTTTGITVVFTPLIRCVSIAR